ncbi:glyoxylate reductase, partial [Cryomyces antarcticus]
MSKPKVLLLGTIDHAHKIWDSLSSIAELVNPSASNRAKFIEECKSGKYDGVKAAYRTFASVSVTGLWDEELVNVLPKSLEFVAHN